MRATKVQIIGGGPGGLSAARFLKLRHPSWDVEVHERMAPVQTFGFGVGLTGRTLDNLNAVDPEAHAALRENSYVPEASRLYTLQDSVQWSRGRTGGMTIGRSVLLEVLLHLAQSAGAVVKLGSEFSLADADADLVIAADGVGSATRGSLADDLGVSVDVGRGLYIWLGLDRALDSSLFAPVQTEHGVFVTHAYPFSPERSTVLIETDEATWRRAGLDAPRVYASEGDSDEASIALLQDAFAPYLEGGRLIGNRSRWLRFRTVRCRRWSAGSTVVLGDAARTAHYSLGSGTKLAIEDAIALVDALQDGADIPGALAAYEQQRRPNAERIQHLAHRSHLWWDDYPLRAAQPAASVALAYLSRGGAVSLTATAQFEPAIARDALAQFAVCNPADVPMDTPDLRAWVLKQPFTGNSLATPNRLLAGAACGLEPGLPPEAWRWLPADTPPERAGAATPAFRAVDVAFADWDGPEAQVALETCTRALENGATGIILRGAAEREAVLNRLAFGERVRRETGAVTAVAGPASCLDDLVDGLVAGRTDLISVTEEEVA